MDLIKKLFKLTGESYLVYIKNAIKNSKEIRNKILTDELDVNQKIKQDMLGEVFHSRCQHCYHLEQNQKHCADLTSKIIIIMSILGLITNVYFFRKI